MSKKPKSSLMCVPLATLIAEEVGEGVIWRSVNNQKLAQGNRLSDSETETRPNKDWLYVVCRDADGSVALTIYDGDVSADIALSPEMADQMARVITGRDINDPPLGNGRRKAWVDREKGIEAARMMIRSGFAPSPCAPTSDSHSRHISANRLLALKAWLFSAFPAFLKTVHGILQGIIKPRRGRE